MLGAPEALAVGRFPIYGTQHVFTKDNHDKKQIYNCTVVIDVFNNTIELQSSAE
jgi:hypothetical protein